MGDGIEWILFGYKASHELPKFVHGNLQVLDDGPQRFSFQFAPVHRNYDTRVVACSDIDSVAAPLPPQNKT